MNRQLPPQLATQTNSAMDDVDIAGSNARFVMRRLVAEAYATGHDDGERRGHDDARSDRFAAEAAEKLKAAEL